MIFLHVWKARSSRRTWYDTRATTGCSSRLERSAEAPWVMIGGEVADRSLLPSLCGIEPDEESLCKKAGGLDTSRGCEFESGYGDTNLVPKTCLQFDDALVSNSSNGRAEFPFRGIRCPRTGTTTERKGEIPVVVGGMERSLGVVPGVASDLAQALEDTRRRIKLIVHHDHGAVHNLRSASWKTLGSGSTSMDKARRRGRTWSASDLFAQIQQMQEGGNEPRSTEAHFFAEDRQCLAVVVVLEAATCKCRSRR